jgi:putative transport protein
MDDMGDLLHQGYFALCVIVLLGVTLGRIKIKGISFDISAVIFIALVFGHYGIVVPDDFQRIGLVLFVFTIGIQSGPGFFEAFRQYGRQLITIAITIVVVGSVIAVVLATIFRLDFKIVVGLLTGALTSTPGLAAAIESAQSPLASIGYGAAYPFGVIGVILFVRLIPKILKIDLKASEEAYAKKTHQNYPKITTRNFIVENTNLDGKTFGELDFFQMTGAKVSRVMHQDEAVTPTAERVLHLEDLITAVGTEEALERIEVLVGKSTSAEIPLSPKYDVQLVLVTNKNVVNKTLEELHLTPLYNVTVTRIRRSGIDISPTAHSRIRFGDSLMIVCEKENMQQVIRSLGNEDKRLSETDVLPIFTGIVLGILLGKLYLQLPGITSLSLGSTGGILIVTILLSKIGKTGPIIWSISGTANQLLRQLGLLFFLSAVGTKAGASLVDTIMKYGPMLFIIGALLTLIPMIVGVLLGHYILRMNFLTLLGVITGAMTSTPGLGAVDAMTDSNAPPVAYATVYPIALVCVIICAQIIARM